MRSLCLLLVVFRCIGTIDTYQCYMCTSATEASCGDPFNANAMTAADKVEANVDEVCVKATINNLISRAAAPRSKCSQIGLVNGCMSTSLEGLAVTMCCCTSNLCNDMSNVGNGVSTVSSGVSTVSSGASTVSSDISTVSNGVLMVQNQPLFAITVGAFALLAY